jgi:EAL domain-containing protein (putative c-di-GMP-specific phosphodiesterase class I)
MLGGLEHHSTPSVGVALFEGHRQSVDELLKQADLAMYESKAAGRNTLRFFDPNMQALVAQRTALEADLRQGLKRNELVLHYQPVVDVLSRVVGVEALVRWRHPLKGLVPPNQFIPMAEQTGLILPLGEWVMETACEQLALWGKTPATASLTIAVNVSARQFKHPEFVQHVMHLLQKTQATAQLLKLELTESLLLSDTQDAVRKMSELRAKGVRFALDDFGTGYSSLSYLKLLPLEQLKIDQSFVRDVLADPNDAAIARTVLALGTSLGLEVVAEGVETTGQRDFLIENGCTLFQGYLFGKPVPIDQLQLDDPASYI